MSRFENCKVCHFWQFDQSIEGRTADGRCRRNPPVIVPSSEPLDTYDAIKAASHFPMTLATDWCGEFQSPSAMVGV